MNISRKISFAVWSLLGMIKLKFHKVQFYGNIFFLGGVHVSNRGRILIGHSCMFISKETGNSIGLNHHCMITTQNERALIKIGNHCGFSGVSLWCFKSIVIGDNVKVGANCLIMDGDAHQDDLRAGKDAPIVIEDNVWLGANVVVMKGVTIGENSLIGINSVVTSDIPPNVVAAGNPCKVIRPL